MFHEKGNRSIVGRINFYFENDQHKPVDINRRTHPLPLELLKSKHLCFNF